MFSLKMFEKAFVFQCSILVANVADSYQITLFARRHCSPRGVSRGLPKKAFEQTKIACWASGAPLGSQAPSWRPFLDFSGRISGSGSFLGCFLDASGPSLVFFQSFLTSYGNIFLNFTHNFWFAFKGLISSFCLSLSFSKLPYVKRHGRPNLPEVVSSCYWAGNWEWV